VGTWKNAIECDVAMEEEAHAKGHNNMIHGA